jgi:hypothetical protein
VGGLPANRRWNVVMLINRRKPYSPWVPLGLLPMVISAPWILR